MAEFPAETGVGGASAQFTADVAGLRAGIDDLAGLLAGSLGLPDLLAQVAAFTQRAIPGADGAAVTLLRVDSTDTGVAALAASAPFVAAIDEVQYVTLDEGSGITAVRERRAVRSGSLGGEKMWPRFGPHAEELGELFAKRAAAAVHNAQVLAEALALNDQLRNALSSRPIIDQAIGLIRGRTGRSVEDAFLQLQAMSQAEHRKLADVAQHVVDEAVRRAWAAKSRPEMALQPV